MQRKLKMFGSVHRSLGAAEKRLNWKALFPRDRYEFPLVSSDPS